MTGITSITFRGLCAEEIIKLALEAGLEGIEWGGDIHVRPGDVLEALRIKKLTESAGLCVLSYGSYYRLCENSNPVSSFQPVLDSAIALGAPMIRIWTGSLPPSQADASYQDSASQELGQIALMAAAHGIRIGTECHRGSLTETAESTLSLLRKAAQPNLTTYWQPNPDLSLEENRAHLQQVLPVLSNLHVFHWNTHEKRPLAEGLKDWAVYLKLACPRHDRALILEFVKDDSAKQFFQDAAALKQLVQSIPAH